MSRSRTGVRRRRAAAWRVAGRMPWSRSSSTPRCASRCPRRSPRRPRACRPRCTRVGRRRRSWSPPEPRVACHRRRVDRQCAGAQWRVGKDGGAGGISNVDGARKERDGVGEAGVCVVGVGGREQQQRQPRVDGQRDRLRHGHRRVVDRGDIDGNDAWLAVAQHRAGTVGGHEGKGVSPVGIGVGHVDYRIEARAQCGGLDLAHLA
eukprot:scaffold95193_cov52-Phaeocystis_antarctica.AAC.1